MVKSIRDIYMTNFFKNKSTIDDIKEFLKSVYHIDLETHRIDVRPHTRWRFDLEKEIKDMSNIVYINCYKTNPDSDSKPFICGITKTGEHGTTDFNFNKNANNETTNYLTTGRSFLNDNNYDYDTSVLYLFGCQSKKEAVLLEREIQHRFNLFES